MMDTLKQGRKVWRYVFVKQTGTLLDIIAVVVTAGFGLYAGAIVLCARFFVGAFTDLTFFSALRTGGKTDAEI